MFPLTYFPNRPFAPRYFPKHGAPPAPPSTDPLQVKISGIDRTDYLYYGSAIGWTLIRGQRGTCTLPLMIYPGDDFAPQVGELVEIFDINQRVWLGTVEGIEIKWIGDRGHHYIILSGVSYERFFDGADIDKVKYSAAIDGTPATCGAAVSDLLSRSGVTAVTAGRIDDGPNVLGLEVTNVARGFADLALLAGFVWYIDPIDATLNFHIPTGRNAAFTLQSHDVRFETMDFSQTRSDVRDTQVIQLPGMALAAVTATFPGDDTTTLFSLPTSPEYLLSVTVTPTGITGKTVSWTPGSQQVRVSPAPLTGETVVIRYMDAGETSATTGFSPSFGVAARRYTTTRMYTTEGGLQQANAMIAQYSTLPSQLVLETDRPGIFIARNLTISLSSPAPPPPSPPPFFPPPPINSIAGSLLNGNWLVMEIEASVVPGLDLQPDPYGHFRYKLHLVNVAATAIYQGDGSTTLFLLPIIPDATPKITVYGNGNTPTVNTWTVGTDQVTVTPAPIDGATVVASFFGTAIATPTIDSFVSAWERLTNTPSTTDTPVPGSQNPPPSGDGSTTAPAVYKATLTLRDLTVADDIAPHVPIHHAGTGLRLLGVLRLTISADLTVRIMKAPGDNSVPASELVTVTIPSSALVDETFEWSLAAGSPAILPPFLDKEVLSADILASDGSSDTNGIANFVVEWELA